jgi:transcriptional regulator with XRE-family HTH domain
MSSTFEPVPAAGWVRAARRRADLNQRDFAVRAGIAASTVGRIESGGLTPSLTVLARLLAVAEISLAAVDEDRRLVLPMLEAADVRNGAGRLYPTHLDTILDPRMGEWWGDRYGLARPPETFHRDRSTRDAQRARSRWEVRVKQTWRDPEPPIVPDGRPRRAR